jgi:AbiU2
VNYRTADEAKLQNIEKMGEALGTQFSAIWQELVQVNMALSEFVVLYGTKRSRVDILNEAASNFFYMTQQVLWESTMLHIARLTDPPNTGGRANLTIHNLAALIGDQALRATLKDRLVAVKKATGFCRDWRNRHFAHRDLDLALNKSAMLLEVATVEKTRAALKAMADVLNAVELHYSQSETAYDFASPLNGALALLYVLDDGIKAKRKREERIKVGQLSDEDLQKEL